MARILIIDDDQEMCRMMTRQLTYLGHVIENAHSLKDGLKSLRNDAYELVFLDVCLPDGNGVDILPKIKEQDSPPEVIILTAYADPESAETAISSGAWEYLQKPYSLNEIKRIIDRASKFHEQKIQKSATAFKAENIIGKSQALVNALDLLAQASKTESSVLITGETGTGKEIFAKALHENSHPSNNEFVVVDCSVLPENLIDSILFGYVKGAFTGADLSKEGLIRQATGGTLFLDEIGELNLNLQKSFLRLLQEKKFRPLGAKKEIETNFRLIAATNRDLDQMVKQGSFREDLLHRINSFIIQLPPLSQRKQDIIELANFYAHKFVKNYHTSAKEFSKELINALQKYPWPGNVRELMNVIDQIIVTYMDQKILYPEHLPKKIRAAIARSDIMSNTNSASDSTFDPILFEEADEFPKLEEIRKAALAHAEKQYLAKLMQVTHGNIKKAILISGLAKSRFYYLLKKYEISRK